MSRSERLQLAKNHFVQAVLDTAAAGGLLSRTDLLDATEQLVDAALAEPHDEELLILLGYDYELHNGDKVRIVGHSFTVERRGWVVWQHGTRTNAVYLVKDSLFVGARRITKDLKLPEPENADT